MRTNVGWLNGWTLVFLKQDLSLNRKVFIFMVQLDSETRLTGILWVFQILVVLNQKKKKKIAPMRTKLKNPKPYKKHKRMTALKMFGGD